MDCVAAVRPGSDRSVFEPTIDPCGRLSGRDNRYSAVDQPLPGSWPLVRPLKKKAPSCEDSHGGAFVTESTCPTGVGRPFLSDPSLVSPNVKKIFFNFSIRFSEVPGRRRNGLIPIVDAMLDTSDEPAKKSA
jgi:hypothetical protein